MSDDATGSTAAEKGLASAAATVASFDDEHAGPLRRIQQFFHQNPTAIPGIILLISVVFFGFATRGNFFTPLNMSLILAQVTLIAALGTAQTLVIITAGIDLSVGAIMVLSSIVMGKLAIDHQVPVPIAFTLGILTGVLCGFVNGLLVTRLRLPPFIVTLGTWSIFAALVTLVSESATIRKEDLTATAPWLLEMGSRISLGNGPRGTPAGGPYIMYGSIAMIVIAFAVWYVLNRTAFGRHVYATGDDPNAARLAGIQTDRTLIGVYALTGLLCGIAGWILIGRVGAVSPLGNQTANLDAITAVVIGGTSLFGGRGSILGTLFGALIVGTFDSGLSLMDVDPLWRQLTTGALIILAVSIDQWIREGIGMSAAEIMDPAMLRAANDVILEGRGLVKRYGRVVALDQADFSLRRNEILGVIGDNGAGKSTLIKALCGAVIPDQGEILLEGQPVHFRSPLEARRAGIETVYQDLALSPALSIADNMFLGRELRKPGIVGQLFRRLDRSAMQRIAREKLSELGLMTIQNINQAVETLSGGQRQGVAVARAAAFGSRVVIMDEPTAALGVKESRRVLDLMQDVRRRGLPIVLISHNMPHVFEVADRIHIHRLGKRIAVVDPKAISMSDAVAIMTGAMKPPEPYAS